MKKLIFIFIIMFLFLTSSNAYALSEIELVSVDSGLTDEQREEYINMIKESSYFLDNKDLYPYYVIFYQTNAPLTVSCKGRVYLYFLDNITFNTNYLNQRYNISSSNNKYVVYYDLISQKFQTAPLNNDLYLMEQDYDDNGIYRIHTNRLYTDYILESNFQVNYHKDFNLYDTDFNLIGSYTTEDDILQIKFEKKPSVNDDVSTEDILDSEDMLYGISKKLLGPLPLEFQFLYSVVTLILGVVLILVVISPFILLIRWLM